MIQLIIAIVIAYFIITNFLLVTKIIAGLIVLYISMMILGYLLHTFKKVTDKVFKIIS